MPQQNLDIANMAACVDDVRRATINGDRGPDDPLDFHLLRGRLEAARSKLPPLYRDTVFSPFVSKLDQIGSSGFTGVLNDNGNARMMLFDIAHTILQNGEGFEEKATDAFQEVVSDLYDGFLSAEDRRGVAPPDLGVIPPLVKWGNPNFGPYTWPIDGVRQAFGLGAAIVNLPPANARGGLLSWATLAHETGGHDIMFADTGLSGELAGAIFNALDAELGSQMATYWAERIDETGADVLGILNTGPAAGVGLIGFFRGFRAGFGGPPKLSSEGLASDVHPADVVRGYLAAATVRLLDFSQASQWATLIERETDRDAESITLAGVSVTKPKAKQAAEIVARTLVKGKVHALENHALGDIQNWRDQDEEIVTRLRSVLLTAIPLPDALGQGTFAAHVVAAAVLSALATGGDIPLLFGRMLTTLKLMHGKNPSWGPLFVAHPGNLAPHFVYGDGRRFSQLFIN
jgi:hypothetical protein